MVYSQTNAGRYILVVLEPVDRGKVQVVSIRLERGSVNRLKAYAQEIGIPYTTLLRMWIIKSYKREVEEESS